MPQTFSETGASIRHARSSGPESNQELREPTIAVLPFKNMSPVRQHDHVGEGMAAELLMWLTLVPGLHVLPRSTVFAQMRKGLDASAIGRQVDATDVLAGIVRLYKDRINIMAELIDSNSGKHVWSENYDRPMEKICLILDEIAAGIVCALDSEEALSGVRMIQHLHTKDVDAYQYYLHGREEFHEFSKLGVESAIELFKRAIELDPSYALAYCGLADGYSYFCTYFYCNDELKNKAFEASESALRLNPELAEAHVSRAIALANIRDFEDAVLEFENAIEMNPELFDAYYFYARTAFMQGNLLKSIELYTKASLVRPDDYQSLVLAGQVYDRLKMYDEAMEVRLKGVSVAELRLEYDPNDERAWYMGANALIGLRRKKRGLEWLQHALDLDPEDPLVLYNAGCIYALLGFTDLALTCLERSAVEGLLHREWFVQDSNLDSLRFHPRFDGLMASMN